MTRPAGLSIGLGGALSILPGISAIGAMVSISSVLGVDKEYSMSNALISGILIMACIAVNDVLRIISNGVAGLTVGIVLICFATAVAAYAGTLLGIRLLRVVQRSLGFSFFAFYCWGMALFTFFLNLIA